MTTTVADQSAAVLAMAPDWDVAAALLGGTRAMRTAAQKYLPKWPNEDDKAYGVRLQTAVLFPAYGRTVDVLTGKPFSKALTYGDDVPAQIKEWLQDDADLQGRSLDVFAADVMQAALGYGICGILVDVPTAAGVASRPDGVLTMAEEQAAGIRPYLIHIQPQQILGWKSTRVKGEWALTQLRLMETVEEDDPAGYGAVEIQQVRLLVPGAWQTFRKNEQDEWALKAEGTTTLDFIPYVPVYGNRTGFMTATPPLIEVANLNVAHWQSASDQQTILHIARVPILTVIGGGDDNFKLTVGGSAVVKLPKDADMKFVEHSGKAITAGATELESLEERMRQAGAELLVLRPGRITATQVATENAAGMSALHRITQSLEDALDQALQFMARWIGQPEGGHVTIFNDYGAASLAEASTQILLQSAMSGMLSEETFFAEMQRRGIVSADVKWVEEKSKIDTQGPMLGNAGAAQSAGKGADPSLQSQNLATQGD